MALLKCKECKNEISDTAKFCPYCGALLKYSDLEEDITTVTCNMTIISVFCVALLVAFIPLTISLCKVNSFGMYGLIPFIIFFVYILILFYSFKSINIKLTSKKVVGVLSLGLKKYEINYPINQIKSVKCFGFLGIYSLEISNGYENFKIPFATNAKKFKKEYFNLLEKKYV